MIITSQGDYGDVRARQILRERLKCKRFDWFLVNIYPELIVPAETLYSGEVCRSICKLMKWQYIITDFWLGLLGAVRDLVRCYRVRPKSSNISNRPVFCKLKVESNTFNNLLFNRWPPIFFAGLIILRR